MREGKGGLNRDSISVLAIFFLRRPIGFNEPFAMKYGDKNGEEPYMAKQVCSFYEGEENGESQLSQRLKIPKTQKHPRKSHSLLIILD